MKSLFSEIYREAAFIGHPADDLSSLMLVKFLEKRFGEYEFEYFADLYIHGPDDELVAILDPDLPWTAATMIRHKIEEDLI